MWGETCRLFCDVKGSRKLVTLLVGSGLIMIYNVIGDVNCEYTFNFNWNNVRVQV